MTERLWCSACGTVTRDMLCDCNRWPDGHEMKREPHFVNYADVMQETAREQAQQIDALMKALTDLLETTPDERQRPDIWFKRVDFARATLAALTPADGGGK